MITNTSVASHTELEEDFQDIWEDINVVSVVKSKTFFLLSEQFNIPKISSDSPTIFFNVRLQQYNLMIKGLIFT